MDKKDIIDIIAGVLTAHSVVSSGGKNQTPAPPSYSASANNPAVDLQHPMAASPRHNNSSSFKKGFFSSGNYNQPFTTLKNKRPFISEYDLKQMLANNPTLTIKIPRNAIISPLAAEIIETRGIKIIYV